MTERDEEIDELEVLAMPAAEDGTAWNPRLSLSGEASWNGREWYPSLSVRVPTPPGPITLKLTGDQARTLRDRLDAALEEAEADVRTRRDADGTGTEESHER